jgi:hypothetical protein
MDLVLIELILWVGLLFFFWALKEGLGHVESDIESLGLARNGARGIQGSKRLHYYRPERVAEQIGSYRDAPIFRYAQIQGNAYQFDRICPIDSGMTVDDEERCVHPGLVYQECATDTRPFDRDRS